jgi:hypothetical protein
VPVSPLRTVRDEKLVVAAIEIGQYEQLITSGLPRSFLQGGEHLQLKAGAAGYLRSSKLELLPVAA